MIDFHNENKIARENMKCAFAALDMLHLAETVRIEWDIRFTRRAGDASHSLKQIRLSIPLWPLATEQERYITVVHEVCHIAAIERYGGAEWGHGYRWEMMMQECGLVPDQYHHIDRTSVRRTQSRYPVKCSCMTHMITKIKYNRIRRGDRKYSCKHCQEILTV